MGVKIERMSAARGGSVLIGALIVDSLGNGLFLPLSLVFFLKLTTVSLAVLGLLASAATVVTLPVPVWTGTLADKFGALPLVVIAQLLQAVGYLAFSWVKNPAGIFVVSALVAIGVRVFWSSIFTAIADYADTRPGQRSKDSWFALANTARTAGLAVGGLAAGAVVASGKVDAYLAIAYSAAASFAVAAALIALFVRAPRVRGDESPTGQGYRVMLGDRPFIALIAVNTIYALSSMMLPLALPTFVLRGLHEPGWLTASVLAGNAILISVLGAPVTKLVSRYRRTRILMSSALLWAAWSLVFAVLVPGHPVWVIPLLIGATLLYTVADVMHAPASVALAAAASPEHVRGRYLAVFQYSWTFASIVGPVFFTQLFGVGRVVPWIVLGVIDSAGAVAILALERRLPLR
jgi:MFS family permease